MGPGISVYMQWLEEVCDPQSSLSLAGNLPDRSEQGLGEGAQRLGKSQSPFPSG